MKSRKRDKKHPSDGLAVRRSSAGLGLFALRPFKKGERIIEYVGRTLSEAETYTSRSKYLFEVNKRKTIDGKPRVNTAGYINHSCRPNCEPHTVRGHVFIESIRAIREGEELTYDYGKEYWDEHIKPHGCRCEKCDPTGLRPRSSR
ncbi:MAG: SET domain-containing protein [bacterium]